MKTGKNFARVAVTAGLTAAMALGNVVAPAAMAFAADAGSTVTFSDADYAMSTTYKGIQIFKATVATTDGAATLSNIEWASDDAKAAVLDAIKAKDTSFASDHAQDAADWLNANTGVDGTDSKVASDNVLSLIAANLEVSPAGRRRPRAARPFPASTPATGCSSPLPPALLTAARPTRSPLPSTP